MTTPDVELRVDGARFWAWTDVTVTASIETACRSFSLTAFRAPGSPTPPLDASCEVWLAGSRVVSGVIGRVESVRGLRSARLSVSGRSRTREIVDCSHVGPGRWAGLTVAQLARETCGPYGVVVLDEAGDTGKLGSFAVERRGETVFALLERAARVRSLLLTDDGDGRLVLTRAGATRSGTISGADALERTITGDSEERYSEIVCHGVRAGDDNTYGDALFAEQSAADDGPLRARTLVIQPEGRADASACLARAQWEIATRYGKSVGLKYTMPGWTLDGATLWKPNVLTRVVDEDEGIDGTFLLASVTYRLTGAEFRTELELSPPEAYQPMPAATRALKTRGKLPASIGIRDVETIPTAVRESYDTRQGSP